MGGFTWKEVVMIEPSVVGAAGRTPPSRAAVEAALGTGFGWCLKKKLQPVNQTATSEPSTSKAAVLIEKKSEDTNNPYEGYVGPD